MITTFPVYLIDREEISFVPDLPNKEYQLASIEDLEENDIKELLPGDKLQLLEGTFTVNYKIVANGEREMYLVPSGNCTTG